MIKLPFLAAMLLTATTAIAAQNTATPESEARRNENLEQAGRIASQPARDVGASKITVPPVLQSAVADPYSLAGLTTCAKLSNAMADLTTELGPDFRPGPAKKENRAGKVAAAGGKTIVNALIPFRSLVREATGAAPAQRRLEAAVDAGLARRGFLRGVYITKRCKPAL